MPGFGVGGGCNDDDERLALSGDFDWRFMVLVVVFLDFGGDL
jgi:hypothetical protein